MLYSKVDQTDQRGPGCFGSYSLVHTKSKN